MAFREVVKELNYRCCPFLLHNVEQDGNLTNDSDSDSDIIYLDSDSDNDSDSDYIFRS